VSCSDLGYAMTDQCCLYSFVSWSRQI